MEDINQEITSLKQKLEALEYNKKLIEEHNKKTNVDLNLNILDQSIKKREDKIRGNNYSKSYVVAKFVDRDMIPPLQSIYNLLHNLNERVENLEKIVNANNVD